MFKQVLVKHNQTLQKLKLFNKTSYFNYFKKSGVLRIENKGGLFIKPKLYADVNLTKEPQYFEFEKMKLKIG